MSSKTVTEASLSNQAISEIDKALNAAKARSAAKRANGETAEKPAHEPKASKEPAEAKRPRLSDEEKQARENARAQERAAKKAERDAQRAAKRAEREASKQPAHMRKVMKAAERLNPLAQAAQLLFNEATANLTASELATLALHMQHFNRVQATTRALGQRVEVGQQVQIVGGDPRFVGKTATVTKVQRIRCYAKIDGVKKDVYLFTSDVAPVAAATQSAAG